MKNFLGKKFRKRDRRARRKTDQTEKGNRTRQKNKTVNSKVESNDSPEIPDRGGGRDIRHPRPPFGGGSKVHISS